MKKQGMSAIITTVIMVALSMVAVLIVWGVVSNIIENSSSDIKSKSDLINLNMKIFSLKQSGDDLIVGINRGVGRGSFSGISFIMEYDDSTEVINQELELSELGSQRVTLDLAGDLDGVRKVSIASYFNDSGKIKIGKVLDAQEVGFGIQIVSNRLNEGLVLDLDFDDGSLLDKSGYGNDGIGVGNTNLIRNGGAEEGLANWFDQHIINSTVVSYDDSHSGEGSFYAVGLGRVDRDNNFLSSELIAIDVNDNYVLSGWFKSNGTSQSDIYFGLAPYDENKEFISIESVYYVNSSVHTALYEDISSSDKVIKINDCTGWIESANVLVAFNVDDSGVFSDLPNNDLSRGGIIRVENVGDYCEVEFSTSVNFNALAGTKIREHSYGGTFQYAAANNQYVPYTWTKYEGSVSGEALYYNGSQNIWRPGTKYARILVIMNYRKDESYSMFADDFNLTVSNGQKIEPLFVNEGKYGGAREFDGVDDVIEVDDSDSLDLANEFTLSSWIKINDYENNSSPYILAKQGDFSGSIGANYGLGVRSFDGIHAIPFSYVGDSEESLYVQNYDYSSLLEKDVWYNILTVRSRDSLDMYVNGILTKSENTIIYYNSLDGSHDSVGSGIINQTVNDNDLTIGSINDAHFFNGLIDEVKIWNRSLSLIEVQRLYSEGI